jgi:hypothetical protein
LGSARCRCAHERGDTSWQSGTSPMPRERPRPRTGERISRIPRRIAGVSPREAAEVVGPEQWVSVIVFGRYEELPDTPEWQSARRSAHTLLKRHAAWWEPAYGKTILHGTPCELAPVLPHSRPADYGPSRHPRAGDAASPWPTRASRARRARRSLTWDRSRPRSTRNGACPCLPSSASWHWPVV